MIVFLADVNLCVFLCNVFIHQGVYGVAYAAEEFVYRSRGEVGCVISEICRVE